MKVKVKKRTTGENKIKKIKPNKIKAEDKNPYPKYSYNSGLENQHTGEPLEGVNGEWLLWEIEHGHSLSY